MEEHPIPQDVTGFQFKLIGNMTIKQFAYVAFGVIVSVILYYLPISIIIKIFLIPLFGGGGILTAFLPVEGRPIDIMAANLFKAIFSPNQFVYQKMGRQFSFTHMPVPNTPPAPLQQNIHVPVAPDKREQLQTLLNTAPVQSQNELDKKEQAYLQSLSTPTSIAIPVPVAKPPSPPAPAPQPAVQPNAELLSKQEQQLTQELEQAKKDDAGNPKVELLERQVQALHFQRQQLEQQLQQLQTQLTASQKIQAQEAAQQRVHNIPKDQMRSQGLPHVSDTPNVIVGIVKDSRGNVLPGMLVEVKDKDGNPVRAFKTNQLGQFASATPLATGMYTIELEDPKNQHSFDVIQIAASNQILLPIEIVSKDAREELRQQLFN